MSAQRLFGSENSGSAHDGNPGRKRRIFRPCRHSHRTRRYGAVGLNRELSFRIRLSSGKRQPELRIPENADPWDSGMIEELYPSPNSSSSTNLQSKGFTIIFAVLMNGRVWWGASLLGNPWKGREQNPLAMLPTKNGNRFPKRPRNVFPSIEEIMQKGEVRSPLY